MLSGEQTRAALFQACADVEPQAEYRFAEAASLHNMARLERARGNLVNARSRAQEALAVAESLRGRSIARIYARLTLPRYDSNTNFT